MKRALRRASALRCSAAVAALLLASACRREVTSVGALVDAAPPRTGVYLEAEDGALSSGFGVEDDRAASGGLAIAPPADSAADDAPGIARARYEVELADAGEYVIWGRIHAPGPDNNRFWFQLDGGDFYKWRISTGETWFWDDFHDDREYGRPLVFPLDAGLHELVIASCVPGVSLDRLYFTVAGDEPPGNDTPCDPPHTIQIGADCLPSCGLLDGTSCDPPQCADRELLPAYDCEVCCRIAP